MGSLSKYSFGSYVGPINTLTSSGRVFTFFFFHFEILGPQMASTSSHLSADHLEEAGNLSFMLWQQVIVSFVLFDSYLFI